MTVECKNSANTASGGEFTTKKIGKARKVIQQLVNATREYNEPQSRLLKRIEHSNAANADLEEKMDAICSRLETLLTTVVEKTTGVDAPVNPCGACGKTGHTSLNCKTEEADMVVQVQAANNRNGPRKDAFSPTYNNYPQQPQQVYAPQPAPQQQNLLHSQNQPQQGHQQVYRTPHQRRQHFQAPHQPPKQGKSLEEMMGELISSQQILQNNAQTSNNAVQQLQESQRDKKLGLEALTKQMSQIAESLNQMRGNEGRIPAQVLTRQKENVSKVTLRSGKQLERRTDLD